MTDGHYSLYRRWIVLKVYRDRLDEKDRLRVPLTIKIWESENVYNSPDGLLVNKPKLIKFNA